jgi:hypothetical protein
MPHQESEEEAENGGRDKQDIINRGEVPFLACCRLQDAKHSFKSKALLWNLGLLSSVNRFASLHFR